MSILSDLNKAIYKRQFGEGGLDKEMLNAFTKREFRIKELREK